MTTQLSPFRATALCHPTKHVTSTEQTIAGIFGFLTAGPVGYLASIATIRSTKGKWIPWYLLGVVAVPTLIFAQILVLGTVIGAVQGVSTSIQRSR